MKKRWYNIFREDNKSFILAMDHAMIMDVSLNLSDPGEVIREAKKGGIDAILTTFGAAKNYMSEIKDTGLILRVDGGTTQLHPSNNLMDNVTQTYTIEDALRIGADGVLCMGFPGLENEKAMISKLSNLSSKCEEWGMVFGAEMIPGGFIKEELYTVENIKFCARLGAEYGADFLKTQFMNDDGAFKQVIDNCYKPILVLGGSKSREDKDLLDMVKDAVDSGVSGVVIGRSIWRHENVSGICNAISKIIHNDASVESVLEELK